MTRLGITAVLWMTPALFAGAVNCGNGLTCNWMEDNAMRASFTVLHLRAVTTTEDPMKDRAHSFVSPSGFWTVVFETFQQYNAPDGHFAPMDEVEVKGYMQHLHRPPGDFHTTDPDQGEKFDFDLTIVEWAGPEDTAEGKKPHGHNDTYSALLTGIDAVAPKTGMEAYGFNVQGSHTEFFTQAGDAPEPATFVMMGAALMLAIVRYKRRSCERWPQSAATPRVFAGR